AKGSLRNRTVIATSSSRRVSFRTAPTTPRLTGLVVDGSALLATWSPLTGPDAGVSTGLQYVVRYRLKTTPERAWTQLPSTSTTAVTQRITSGLRIGGTFEVQVAAKNSEGQSTWSATKEILYTTPPS